MMSDTDIDPVILREYDIRGIVGESLTPDTVRAIGQAFATMALEKGYRSAAVGYDGRLSSPELADALAAGLAAAGMVVVNVGIGPTPMLYYATFALPADTGIMVTGSHNPPEYNGLKLTWGGKPFWGKDIQALGKRLADGDLATGSGHVATRSILTDYVDRIAGDYRPGKALRVAWDPGNGAAGDACRLLTERLPGEHTIINGEIDGRFPNHHPDPTVEKNLDQLKAAVRDGACDAGIAFDGDGDRIGVVDGEGRVLWGGQILLLLAREILEDSPGATVIADVKASRILFDEVARLGGRPLMWKTGHSLIKAKMKETGAPLAGEMSAHLFIGDRYYGYDDALYAAVRLLSLLARADETLAQLRDEMPETVNTPGIRIPCPEERKFAVVEEVRDRLAGLDGIDVVDIDGVRVEAEEGWWLLRASNTQAVLVVRCEAKTEADLDRLKSAVAEQLAASGLEFPENP